MGLTETEALFCLRFSLERFNAEADGVKGVVEELRPLVRQLTDITMYRVRLYGFCVYNTWLVCILCT